MTNARNSNQKESDKKKMSAQEAGRLKAQAHTEKYTHEEPSKQVRQTAQAVEKEHPGLHAEIGPKGGKAHRAQS